MLTLLEQALPRYSFSQRHTMVVPADVQAVWQALSALTFDQLRVTRPLYALRHFGHGVTKDPSDVGRRLLTEGPVDLLEVTPPVYAIGGSISRPWQPSPQRRPVTSLAQFTAFEEPGWVKYLTDFRLQPHEYGVQLTSVTRGYATDPGAWRRFAPYWTLIRPFSGLVRRDVLAAVARAAQR